MSDNPLDRIPNFDRVSVRAVAVMEGEDPGPLLAAAGIIDPVAVPAVFGDSAPNRGFGDGFTPNLFAVVEFDEDAGGIGSAPGGDDFGAVASDASSSRRASTAGSDAGAAPGSEPATVMLPAAFGLQPVAPVRRFGGTASGT